PLCRPSSGPRTRSPRGRTRDIPFHRQSLHRSAEPIGVHSPGGSELRVGRKCLSIRCVGVSASTSGVTTESPEGLRPPLTGHCYRLLGSRRHGPSAPRPLGPSDPP